MKNALGHLAYLLQGIKELSELHPYKLSGQYEGGVVEGEYIVGLIMNSFSIGGFKNPVIALTELNDGVFAVILVKMLQKCNGIAGYNRRTAEESPGFGAHRLLPDLSDGNSVRNDGVNRRRRVWRQV